MGGALALGGATAAVAHLSIGRGAERSTIVSGGAEPVMSESAMRSVDRLTERVDDLLRRASARASITGVTIGRTGEGRTIGGVRIGDPDTPGLLVIAGFDARHAAGVETALGLIEAMHDDADRRERVTAHAHVVVVPMVNVDGFTALEAAMAEGVDMGSAFVGTTRTPIDHDRDRRVDEDPPSDLDGDGAITTIRLADPPPGSRYVATHVADKDEPRRMRPAKDGERPTHAVFTEGLDADGDGAIAEDPVGGIDLDKSFPALWPEYDVDSGHFAGQAPEAHALMEWTLDQERLYGVLVLGAHASALETPVVEKFDESGRVPLGILKADEGVHDDLVALYRSTTGIDAKAELVALRDDDAGSFERWAVAHLGLLAASTPAWVCPDFVGEAMTAADAIAALDGADTEGAGDGDDEAVAAEAERADAEAVLTTEAIREMVAAFEAADEAGQAEMMGRFNELSPTEQQRVMAIAQGEADPMPPAEPEAKPEEEAASDDGDDSNGRPAASSFEGAWLAWIDAERDGVGMTPWTTFEHPQLGEVEIGGLDPRTPFVVPASELSEVVTRHAEFVEALVARFPRTRIEEPRVESVAPGLVRIAVRVHNDGAMPTRLAIGERARRLVPTLASIDAPVEGIVQGDRIVRLGAIAPGAYEDVTWVVRATRGQEFEVRISDPILGERTFDVRDGSVW